MELLPIFLPLFGAVSALFFGRLIGQRWAVFLTTSLVGISLLLSVWLFCSVGLLHTVLCFSLLDWFTVGDLSLSWSFYFDSLTVVMCVVVLSISFCVHLYSSSYMETDPHLARFFSYLSLFTFFMLLLVTSSNFVQLFVGWEGVGVCSYLLISFWFSRKQANKSALKAMVVNRVGDFGLLLAMFIVYSVFKSLDFSTVFALVPSVALKEVVFFSYSVHALTAVSLLLFVGAVGKSAQLGLHTWLPDAMEGPTPVSALIHAATMVTAGVFLLIRCSPILEYSPTAKLVIVFLGALTALFGATVGFFQNDLKRVIAYSTCSQLGYMVFACGLSAYNLAVFHLYNHAFFKALLFLGAGAVIHAYADEQDMRRMGGLVRLLPFTYTVILIGSLALAGTPFLTGFYSKDLILEVAGSSISSVAVFSYWLGVLAAFFTAFYSARLLYLTFLSSPRGYRVVYEEAGSHEAPVRMAAPLFLLSLASIFIGYLSRDLFVGLGTDFWGSSIFIAAENLPYVEAEFLSISEKLIPLMFSLSGVFLSFVLHYLFFSVLVSFNLFSPTSGFFLFFNKRWFFDKVYNELFTKPGLIFGYSISFRLLDRGVIEIFGPTGLSRFFVLASSAYSQVQSGYLYHYIFFMVGAISLTLLFAMWGCSALVLKLFSFCVLLFLLLPFYKSKF